MEVETVTMWKTMWKTVVKKTAASCNPVCNKLTITAQKIEKKSMCQQTAQTTTAQNHKQTLEGHKDPELGYH